MRTINCLLVHVGVKPGHHIKVGTETKGVKWASAKGSSSRLEKLLY
jgi:hypothetical protein